MEFAFLKPKLKLFRAELIGICFLKNFKPEPLIDATDSFEGDARDEREVNAAMWAGGSGSEEI